MFQLKKIHIIWILLIMVIVNSTTGKCEWNAMLTGGKTTSVDIVSKIPFELIEGNILIKAKINTSIKEYTFLLDTGASTLINRNVANELGDVKTSTINTVDAANITKKVDVIQLKSLKIGDIEVEDCGALVLDLDQLTSYGIKVDGFIGGNFLNFFLVKIDYVNKVLTLSSKTDSSMMPNRGYKVNLYKDNYGYIFAHFNTGKIKNQLRAQIDTGSSGQTYLTFPSSLLKKLKPELNCKLVKTIGAGAGGVFGTQKSLYSRLSIIELDGLKVSNLPVEFFESPYIIITNAFLSHFDVTINYPQSKMVLEPNGVPFKTNIDFFGFMAKKDENGKVKIIGLWEGSPAKRKGLKVGDEIIGCNINGKDMKVEDILTYRVGAEDVELRLRIANQSGKQREVVLKKGKLLPEM